MKNTSKQKSRVSQPASGGRNGGPVGCRDRSRSGVAMMEYVIVTLVMAIAVLFASTWLFDWDGGDTQDHNAGAIFQSGDVDFVKDKGAGPEIKAMYQRVHAGIALPAP